MVFVDETNDRIACGGPFAFTYLILDGDLDVVVIVSEQRLRPAFRRDGRSPGAEADPPPPQRPATTCTPPSRPRSAAPGREVKRVFLKAWKTPDFRSLVYMDTLVFSQSCSRGKMHELLRNV